MDVERVVAGRLSASTGVPAFLEMPEGSEDPGDLITVELTGGGGNLLEACLIDVDCWSTGKDRRRAREIAEAVSAAVCDLDEEPNIFHPVVTNRYRMNDPDTRRPRYVVQVELYVCE